jgi:hypothetical protein
MIVIHYALLRYAFELVRICCKAIAKEYSKRRQVLDDFMHSQISADEEYILKYRDWTSTAQTRQKCDYHSHPQSHFHSVTRCKLDSGLDDQRERSDWLLRELLFRRSWAIFTRQIFLSKYVNTNTSFLRNTSLWKLLRVLKRPNSRVCALESTVLNKYVFNFVLKVL